MFPALALLAFRLTRSREAAEDIASDVFVQLWEGRANLNKVESIKAYLYISTRNRTLSHLKRISAHGAIALSEQAMAAFEPTAAAFFAAQLHVETVRALREALAGLPPECRKVTELVLQGHSTNEIAHMLHVTPSAVSRQKARAVRLLKDNELLLVLLSLPAGLLWT